MSTTTTSPPSQQTKHCQTCGRIISPNHRNFQERKHCSKTCSSTRLSAIDREIEETFRRLATERGASGVACGEVEKTCTSGTREGEENARTETDAQKAGMESARWRERVRRAGRRVLVLDQPAKFECVQGGKVVEPSFAKGEWYVRHLSR
ncbi:MAG: hypothetical protein M1828_006423 [Chrysothrix sp. TS-e1954]|nr:MAG: hypothetical protein M1828_006423 [Chrysothrix sp. TS-e1954]